jgi:DNA-binding CsgD family transcriptional regulator
MSAPVLLEALPGAPTGGPAGRGAWPAVIEHLGEAAFWPALLGLCHDLTGASDLSLLTCRGDAPLPPPVLVAAASHHGDAAARAGLRYLRDQHYRLDHNLRGLPALDGRMAFSQLQAAQLPSSAWRNDCYDDVGLAGRLSLLVPAAGQWIVLNAYRPHRCAVSGESAAYHLRQQAPALAAALRRHLALTAPAAATSAPASATAAAPDPLAALSARERQVVAAILAGHSAKECGRQLGLSPTSVATYRQRAFQKLGVRRQVELWRLCSGWTDETAGDAAHSTA